MTKTLYDFEVEKRGMEKGMVKGEEIVVQGVGLSIEEVREIKRSLIH